MPINVLDAIGLSVLAVIGASKALTFGRGIGPAIIMGALTDVGGGAIRDTLVRQVPSVLHSERHAIAALIAAAITVGAIRAGVYGLPAALVAAAGVCFPHPNARCRIPTQRVAPIRRRSRPGTSDNS